MMSSKEQIEIDFWQGVLQSIRSGSPEPILGAIGDASIFWEKFCEYRTIFEAAATIIEIGSGPCVASCLVKHTWPTKTVLATDISRFALAASFQWEHILSTKLDGTLACRSYQVPIKDNAIDLVFCFQAAHHFVYHRRTLVELNRILRPGGSILYLHEPGCQSWSYHLAYHHMNRRRPEVPEDALIYSRIISVARGIGLECRVNMAPTITNKKPMETLYHGLLKSFQFLRKLVPCIVDFIFTKPMLLPFSSAKAQLGAGGRPQVTGNNAR